MRRFLLVLLCVSSFTTHAQDLPEWISPEGQDDPHVGKVLDTANGIWLTPNLLVESLVSAPHVMVGEKHDNPDHHRLQLWLLESLQAHRPQGSLVMEMLGPSQQAAVDRLQGETTFDPDALPDALEWNPGWDWALYGPLVQWGLTNPQRLLAANLAEDEMRTVYASPQPLADAYSAEALALLNETIATSHCGKLPEEQFPPMLAIQQARDQRIVSQLIDAPTPALLLAGSYHVRKDVGAPVHWPANDAPAPLVVLLVEAGGALPDRMQADFVWLTPALPDMDYCAQWE